MFHVVFYHAFLPSSGQANVEPHHEVEKSLEVGGDGYAVKEPIKDQLFKKVNNANLVNRLP